MRPAPPHFPADLILLDHPAMVVVNKPSGALVHNSDYAGPRERSLREEVRTRLKHTVFPVHRLDRGTSGALLFAPSREAVADLQAALGAETAAKRYVALVRGELAGPQMVEHPVKTPDGTELPARSLISPLCTSAHARCSLVEITLLTGRKHQARLHLRHLRCPVLGDSNYGDTRQNRNFRERFGLKRLALHARELEAVLPNGQMLAVRARIGDDLYAPLSRLFSPEDLGSALGTNTSEVSLGA